jgi:hypothetical protein
MQPTFYVSENRLASIPLDGWRSAQRVFAFRSTAERSAQRFSRSARRLGVRVVRAGRMP